jgi:hypothetical protein
VAVGLAVDQLEHAAHRALDADRHRDRARGPELVPLVELGVEVGVGFGVVHQVRLAVPVDIADHAAVGTQTLPEEVRRCVPEGGHEVEQGVGRRLAALERPVHQDRSGGRRNEVVGLDQDLGQE